MGKTSDMTGEKLGFLHLICERLLSMSVTIRSLIGENPFQWRVAVFYLFKMNISVSTAAV